MLYTETRPTLQSSRFRVNIRHNTTSQHCLLQPASSSQAHTPKLGGDHTDVVEGTFFYFILGFRGLISSIGFRGLIFSLGFRGLIFINSALASAASPSASASAASSSSTQPRLPRPHSLQPSHCLYQANTVFTSVRQNHHHLQTTPSTSASEEISSIYGAPS